MINNRLHTDRFRGDKELCGIPTAIQLAIMGFAASTVDL